MYEEVLDVGTEDIIRVMEEHHSVVYKTAIKKACAFAEAKHKGQLRDSGEPYINHPKRVAYSIARWGLDNESVIAALLHDVIEDCGVTHQELADTFNQSIANLVENVTSVSQTISEAEKNHLTKQDIDKMSTTKLLKNMNRKALMIKTADRLDNLNTIGCHPIEKQIRKARDTREILIPIAYRAGAFQLIDELESFCIKIEHNERYNDIAQSYNKILIHNTYSTDFFLNNLVYLVNSLIGKTKDPKHGLISDENSDTSLSKAIKCIEYKKRSIPSLYRQAINATKKISDVSFSYFTKENTATYDISIIVKDEYLNAREDMDIKDIFFQLYDKYLMYCGVEIRSINFTSHGNSSYILISDETNNLYRVFIRSEFDYLRYMLGDIVEGKDEFNFKVIDERDPRNTYTKKIKVFRRDGSEMYIDEGSTVLDFAFAIHTTLGLHFDYAVIDGDPSHHGPYTRLNEGDLIIIYDSETVVPSIKWFRYVKTSKAIDRLIKAIAENNNIPL